MNGNGFNGRRRPYGEYQKRIFLECLEDAREISSSDINVDAFRLALAFFRKRCKPLYYYLKYGNGYGNNGYSERNRDSNGGKRDFS